MKKSLLALATLSAFAGTAYADDGLFTLKNDDTTLSFYGVLDAAYGSVNHSYGLNNTLPNQMYSFAAQKAYNGVIPGSQTGAINGGLSDSRWGIKGSKVIVDGMKAIFDLESGFDITNMKRNNAAGALAANPSNAAPSTVSADSSLNGGMFDRAAWVGVDASWGKLTFGTQNNPMKDAIGKDDPVQSDTFSPFGESGTWGGGAGSSEQSRMHHSLKYSTKLGGGFDMDLAYQFGNDMRTNLGHTYAARVGYNNDTFGVNASYSNTKDGVIAGNSATTLGQISVALSDVTGYEISGHYKVTQDGQIKAGYEHFTRKAPSDLSVPLGSLWGFGVTGGVTSNKFTPGNSQSFSVFWLGGDYNFRSDLNLAVGYYDTKQDAATNNPTSDGKVGVWSAVLKYNLTKRLDLYTAATTNKFSGNAYPSTSYAQTVTGYAIGARYKF